MFYVGLLVVLWLIILIITRNPRIACSSLPQMDLSKWKDGGKSCSVKGKAVSLGRHKRISPCVSCVCTLEGVMLMLKEIYKPLVSNWSVFLTTSSSPVVPYAWRTVSICRFYSLAEKSCLTRRVLCSAPSPFAVIHSKHRQSRKFDRCSLECKPILFVILNSSRGKHYFLRRQFTVACSFFIHFFLCI